MIGDGRGLLLRFLLLSSLAILQLVEVESSPYFEPFNVSYDHRALILGGKRRMLTSAGIHYPRATPEVNSKSFFLLLLFVYSLLFGITNGATQLSSGVFVRVLMGEALCEFWNSCLLSILSNVVLRENIVRVQSLLDSNFL